jgi:starvation-inducible outer membrane lipoprotein
VVSLRFIAGLLVLTGCVSHPPQAEHKVIDCCANFGIDVNPVLGPKAANCGTINIKALTLSARRKNQAAIACVRDAQSRGRALVVNQGFSVEPDYYLRNVVVFGVQGEKVLVVIEFEHDGPTVFAGPCDVLKVLDSGNLEYSGCRTDDALLERMKPASER